MNSLNNEKLFAEVYSNPIVDYVNIKISIPFRTSVVAELYNETGKLVQTKDLGVLNNGEHLIKLNAPKQSSGMAYVMIKAGNDRLIKKLIIK